MFAIFNAEDEHEGTFETIEEAQEYIEAYFKEKRDEEPAYDWRGNPVKVKLEIRQVGYI